MNRKPNETFLAYCQRATNAFSNREISYEEWANSVADDISYGEETIRRAHKVMSQFFNKLNKEYVKDLTDEDVINIIQNQKDDIIKERKKLQTVNLEYQNNLRFDARSELFNEKVEQAIKCLEPIKPISINRDLTKHIDTTALLCISDFHAGSTYEVKGMYGEIVNAYNFDILQTRMWKLLNDIYNDDMAFDELVITCLGDYFENILRMSSLTKLREPVVDTVIKFSEFMSQFIAECARKLQVPVKVLFVGGNHDVNRILGNNPINEDENLGKLVQKFVELRLAGIDSIEIKPYSDVIIESIYGSNLMFVHGKDNNLQDTIEYFSNLYNVECDAVYAGHYHRPESKTVGITDIGDREVFRCGSICGVDPYAKSIRKSARPSALMSMYTENGRGWSKNYYL